MQKRSVNSWIIAREGIPFILFWTLPLLIGIFFDVYLLSIAGAAGGILTALFFRNPPRHLPAGVTPSTVISPADGKIVDVSEVIESRFLKKMMKKASIFMSVTDVHVNRSPVSGKIIDQIYSPGKFLMAQRHKSSVLNEQNAYCLEVDDEKRTAVVCVQIAGFIARRIVSYFGKGDSLTQGQMIGLIRFGSRVDIYLPLSAEIRVKKGDRVAGGETIIGELAR
ncbi:MAG: phosphatidylserine decarboxylase family protein [Deltaproteobacteria bacterium]|nr:phosphatidylserine decarboxylase family protein [Deltaproteobacteria bacterium]